MDYLMTLDKFENQFLNKNFFSMHLLFYSKTLSLDFGRKGLFIDWSYMSRSTTMNLQHLSINSPSLMNSGSGRLPTLPKPFTSLGVPLILKRVLKNHPCLPNFRYATAQLFHAKSSLTMLATAEKIPK